MRRSMVLVVLALATACRPADGDRFLDACVALVACTPDTSAADDPGRCAVELAASRFAGTPLFDLDVAHVDCVLAAGVDCERVRACVGVTIGPPRTVCNEDCLESVHLSCAPGEIGVTQDCTVFGAGARCTSDGCALGSCTPTCVGNYVVGCSTLAPTIACGAGTSCRVLDVFGPMCVVDGARCSETPLTCDGNVVRGCVADAVVELDCGAANLVCDATRWLDPRELCLPAPISIPPPRSPCALGARCAPHGALLLCENGFETLYDCAAHGWGPCALDATHPDLISGARCTQ